MPSKKKKYNARFPAGRIKKIMQTDEEVGKVAQAVPVIISRTLELFVKSLLTKSAQITQARNAKTLTPSHMKQCILSESRFDFLKDLVKNIPDATTQEDNEMLDYTSGNENLGTNIVISPSPSRRASYTPNYQLEQGSSNSTNVTNATPVIQFGSTSNTTKNTTDSNPKIDFSIQSLVQTESTNSEPKIHIDLTNIIRQPCPEVPSLIPLAHNNLYQGNNDNLCIDEDYDN